MTTFELIQRLWYGATIPEREWGEGLEAALDMGCVVDRRGDRDYLVVPDAIAKRVRTHGLVCGRSVFLW